MSVAGTAFAEAYHGAKAKPASFEGCLTGGRMAMMESDRYPEDYPQS
jgi:feruloyl esterase